MVNQELILSIKDQEKTWKDLGYNSQISREVFLEELSALDYNSLIPKSGLDLSRLSFLNATKITSGTLIVKDGDVAAKIIAKALSGKDVVVIDTNGITIYDGKLTIQNEDGTTIIDGFGLVSSANFGSGSVTGGDFAPAESTSFQDVTDVTLDITLARSAKVFFSYGGIIGTNNAHNGHYATAVLNVAGVDTGPEIRNSGNSDGVGIFTASTAIQNTILTLSAGTTTVKMRLKSSATGGSMFAGFANISYIILGA